MLHYVEDKRAVLRELNRMLGPGGRFVNFIPNRWCPAPCFRYPHPLYSPLKFKRDMEAVGFREVPIGSVNFVPPAIGRRLSYSIGGLALVAGRKR